MTDTLWPVDGHTDTPENIHRPQRSRAQPVSNNRCVTQSVSGPAIAVSGALLVRLARTPLEIIGAQRLRYEVFFEEMGARPRELTAREGLDFDPLDDICDHLLVIDRSGARERIVGTSRLLSQDVASSNGGFYSAGEYDICALLNRFPEKRFLEVGRSCVHRDFRKKRSIELLWQGLWTFIRQHNFDAMFGCASLPGTDPMRFADSIRLIAAEAATPPNWKVPALPGLGTPVQSFGTDVVDARRALKDLPPLVKAYMRLGAYFSDDLFIDAQFQTSDFLVILPVEQIRDRYFNRFGTPDAFLDAPPQPLMS